MTPSREGREAGRELDATIATMVMPLPVTSTSNTRWEFLEIPRYSSDIAAAFLVVEAMRAKAPTRYKNLSLVSWCYNRTYATFDAEAFTEYDADTWAEANGEHHDSLAICLAALKAVAPAASLS